MSGDITWLSTRALAKATGSSYQLGLRWNVMLKKPDFMVELLGEEGTVCRVAMYPNGLHFPGFYGVFEAPYPYRDANTSSLPSAVRGGIKAFVRSLWVIGEFPYGQSRWRDPIDERVRVLLEHAGDDGRALQLQHGIAVSIWGARRDMLLDQAGVYGEHAVTRAGVPFRYFMLEG